MGRRREGGEERRGGENMERWQNRAMKSLEAPPTKLLPPGSSHQAPPTFALVLSSLRFRSAINNFRNSTEQLPLAAILSTDPVISSWSAPICIFSCHTHTKHIHVTSMEVPPPHLLPRKWLLTCTNTHSHKYALLYMANRA